MPHQRSEYPKTSYASYVVGDGEFLLTGRTYTRPPTGRELTEQLVRFNRPRRDEHRKTTVLVVKTEQVVSEVYTPTTEEIDRERQRISVSLVPAS